jgi:hypothetical protein
MVELNQSLLAELGGWPALKEARALVERGKVLEVTREGAVIRARVQGAEKVHEPRITLADRVANVEVRCTCAESRRSGRVCAHALAAGLAMLQPADGSRRTLAGGPPATQPAPALRKLPRFALDEAPPGTPRLEFTVLLPLQLADALAKDPVRVILEARRDGEAQAQAQPLDAVLPSVRGGFAVSDEDEQMLAALERATGGVAGVNAIPRAKIGAILHALAAHPRVWLGKKQCIEVHAAAERPQLLLSTRADNSLEVATRVPSRPTSVRDDRGLPSLPWMLEGTTASRLPARSSSRAGRFPSFSRAVCPSLSAPAT